MTPAFDRNNLSRRETYTAFLKGRLSVNEGMLFENVVAQMVVAAGMRPYYHEFYIKGGDEHLYEMDFLLARGNRAVPVEVKSAISSRHASLDHFIGRYHRMVRSSVVVRSRDLRVDGGITYLPVYMAPFLQEYDWGHHDIGDGAWSIAPSRCVQNNGGSSGK